MAGGFPGAQAQPPDETAGSVRVVLDVAWKCYAARYAGRVTLLFQPDSLTISFQGAAVEEFAANRIGLVVLHRPDDAGRPITVTSPGGNRTGERGNADRHDTIPDPGPGHSWDEASLPLELFLSGRRGSFRGPVPVVTASPVRPFRSFRSRPHSRDF